MHDFFVRFPEILQSESIQSIPGVEIGSSRAGHPIFGYKFGTGATAISLIGGCHSDEPVGPKFLRHFISFLHDLQNDDPLLSDYEWWIIPHANPDGELLNKMWYNDTALDYSLISYLKHAFREQPGDDIEFGFPRSHTDLAARPENRAIYKWWKSSSKPFKLHASLHGMGFGAGPWFLLDRSWIFRTVELRDKCSSLTKQLGYVLHDIERNGEKGFFRIEKGFCTRPDSRYMIQHFNNLGDAETADKFRPSSMETIKSLYSDSLTIVSEMPLFITPGVGDILGPPDPKAAFWKGKIEEWKKKLVSRGADILVEQEAEQLGLYKMDVFDQMQLLWRFITAGIFHIQKDQK